MKRMLRGATALVTVAGLLEPAFAADLRPLVATQPDPSADVAPYFVADTDPRWTDAAGFSQTYVDTNAGETITVQPFRVGPEQNSTFKDSTDHSHSGLAAKIDVKNGVPQMDKFAFVEWRRYARSGSVEGEATGKQFARLVM